jgi:hypothetical protein
MKTKVSFIAHVIFGDILLNMFVLGNHNDDSVSSVNSGMSDDEPNLSSKNYDSGTGTKLSCSDDSVGELPFNKDNPETCIMCNENFRIFIVPIRTAVTMLISVCFGIFVDGAFRFFRAIYIVFIRYFQLVRAAIATVRMEIYIII